MRNMLLAALLASGAVACTKADTKSTAVGSDPSATLPTSSRRSAPPVNVGIASVDDVEDALDAGKCTVVDASDEHTRNQTGTIPDAVLLTSADDYALSELPSDKSEPLVFYCADTRCGAAHRAAVRATTAGYTNVKVMPEGIGGWRQAGKVAQKKIQPD